MHLIGHAPRNINREVLRMPPPLLKIYFSLFCFGLPARVHPVRALARASGGFRFCLHSFTGWAQHICAQRNRGEGFYPSAFTHLFIGERESVVLPLLLLDMHKCSLTILYASAVVSEDLGEEKMPFPRKAFTSNAMIHCKMQKMGEEVKAKNEK